MRLTIGSGGSRLDHSDGSGSLTIRLERPEVVLTDPDDVRVVIRSLDVAQHIMRKNGELEVCPVCGTIDDVGFGRDGLRWFVECRRCGIRTRPNPVQKIVVDDWNSLRRG